MWVWSGGLDGAPQMRFFKANTLIRTPEDEAAFVRLRSVAARSRAPKSEAHDFNDKREDNRLV